MKSYISALILCVLGTQSALADEPTPPATEDLQAAAQRGEAEAQFNLARAYLRGSGVPQDPERAFSLMRLAAAQDHPEALGGMGYFYSTGLTVEEDPQQAAEWFRKGAEKGSAKAQFNLGKLLLSGKTEKTRTLEQRCVEGLGWIEKAAEQGMVEAALAFGTAHYFGDHGLSKNPEKAFPFLKSAARQGNPSAQNFVGTMYSTGQGVGVDAAQARIWFHKAALQDHAKAQSALGRSLNPLSKDKDIRIEAVAWLMMASARGEVTADKSLFDAKPSLSDGDLAEARLKMVELGKTVVRIDSE